MVSSGISGHRRVRDRLENKELASIIYPYHLGNEIVHFTTALLYHGRLCVGLPTWASQAPLQAFDSVLQRAEHTQHSLLPVFKTVQTALMQASGEARHVTEALSPLGSRLQKVVFVNPGNIETYEAQANLSIPHDIRNRMVRELENSAAWRQFAATEFTFRIYELSLQLGTDPDIILAYLEGVGRENLLVQCAVNRLTKFESKNISTNSDTAVKLLSSLAEPIIEQTDTAHTRIQSLAMYFFESVTAQYVPPLIPKYLNDVLEILETREDELESLRKKCYREAETLIYQPAQSEDFAKYRIRDRLETMLEEVSSIAKIDSETTKSILSRVAEDSTVWATVLGFVGSGIAGLPSVIPASLAVVLLSKTGASTLSELRQRHSRLRKSPWAAIYYMNRISAAKENL